MEQQRLRTPTLGLLVPHKSEREWREHFAKQATSLGTCWLCTGSVYPSEQHTDRPKPLAHSQCRSLFEEQLKGLRGQFEEQPHV